MYVLILQLSFSRCFPHIVNLACKAVLGVITQLRYAKEDAADFVPDGEAPPPATFEEALKRDPVATTRSLIRGVSTHCLRFLALLTSYRFEHPPFDVSTSLKSSKP